MLPYIEIGPLSVPSYGLCAVLGAISALLLCAWRNRYGKIPIKNYFLFLLFALLGLFIGARIMYVISRIPDMIRDFDIKRFFLTFITGGIVFYGGLLGFIGGAYIYMKVAKIDIHTCYNLYAPGIPLFHAFGRVGCLLGGCCYGMVCSWGVKIADVEGLRMPVQLFEAVAELIIFIILLVVEKKKGDKARLLELYLVLYAPVRFVLEFFRGDDIRGFFGPFTTSQYVSVLIIAAVIIYETLILPRKKQSEETI